MTFAPNRATIESTFWYTLFAVVHFCENSFLPEIQCFQRFQPHKNSRIDKTQSGSYNTEQREKFLPSIDRRFLFKRRSLLYKNISARLDRIQAGRYNTSKQRTPQQAGCPRFKSTFYKLDRHFFTKWRSRFILTVTVNPKICNVMMIGIVSPPFGWCGIPPLRAISSR